MKFVPPAAFLAVLGLTFWLWGENLANPLLMGTAEGARVDVSSHQSGMLTQLNVLPYQPVQAGEAIAVVNCVEPDVARNKLAVLRAELELIRTSGGLRPGDQIRYAQFQLDWMLERADLAALRAQQIYAENEFKRLSELFESEVEPPAEFDVARRDLDQANQLVRDKEAAVETARLALEQLDPGQLAQTSPSLQAQLRVAESELGLAEAELQPLTLTAPISGRISMVEKHPGSTVQAGETIVTITSPNVDYILGYVRQPIRIEPSIGMQVEVRSRGLKRETGEASIIQIGAGIELFNAPLRVRGMGNAQERGLPIIISVPRDMMLRPGELVDLAIIR